MLCWFKLHISLTLPLALSFQPFTSSLLFVSALPSLSLRVSSAEVCSCSWIKLYLLLFWERKSLLLTPVIPSLQVVLTRKVSHWLLCLSPQKPLLHFCLNYDTENHWSSWGNMNLHWTFLQFNKLWLLFLPLKKFNSSLICFLLQTVSLFLPDGQSD